MSTKNWQHENTVHFFGGRSVRPHGTLSGYNGVMVFRSDEACIISTPKNIFDELANKFHNQPLDKNLNSLAFEQALGNRIDKIIGPAYLGQMCFKNYKPQHDKSTRQVTDWQLFEKLLAECSDEEVELSSLQSGRSPVMAVFDQEKIATAAGYELMENIVAHIGVLTHPDFRGKGYAKMTISATAEMAMQKQLGLQYWTHINNVASIKAASALGFTKFAETLAIRLK